ncbi:MAG: GIY-YIG nuclease family protein [Methylococcales bacterium]|nr:GIY-YIG nuclease family protein [Methylococcales bacterium]
MIDFEKELAVILADDPLGLLVIKPKASSGMNMDERLLSSFEEINTFINEQGHEPQASQDINERKLYSRLKGLRENPEKVAALIQCDSFDLFATEKMPVVKEINTIADVLEDDFLGLLGSNAKDEEDPTDIFKLRHVTKTIDMPEQIARRVPCKNFDKYEQLFKQCHRDLVSGASVFKPFTGEQQITAGHFFILHGVMVYVADVGEKEKKRGKVNARLLCIFENGTESNMLLRSLATELYKDENGVRVLPLSEDLLMPDEHITHEDQSTGYIYILQSLTEDNNIRDIADLYKIGYSSQPVKERIKNASQEPTYLMADVKLLSEFQTFNLNPQKLELLLHTFFAEACLNIDVFDKEGKRYTPREWFIVPLQVIEIAVRLLINGEIINYRYDNNKREIIEKVGSFGE